MTDWLSRRLADSLGRARGIRVSHDSITVLWHKFCLQPHRTEGFKFSTDPQLEAKIRDVVGLYLASTPLTPGQLADPGPNGRGAMLAAHPGHDKRTRPQGVSLSAVPYLLWP